MKIGPPLKKTIYLLPLCILAFGIVQFIAGTLFSNSFEADCHRPSTPYRFLDFSGYYAGGKLAASPDRASFYTPEIQHRYLGTVRGTDPMGANTNIMQYPPYVACLMIPLAMLAPTSAFSIYSICSLLAHFAAVFLLFALRGDEENGDGAKSNFTKPNFFVPVFIAAFALLGTVPFQITTMLGQMSNFLLFIVSAYFYCLLKKKDITAGVLLAMTGFKPHYALFWAAAAIGQKRWKVLAVAAIVETILLAMAVAVLGWPAVAAYPATILQSDNAATNSEASILMVCVRGLLFTTTHSPLVFPLAVGVMLLGLGYTLALWYRRGTNFALSCAATVVLCIFTSLHTYVYDAVLLIIPGVLLLGHNTEGKTGPRRFAAGLLLATPYLQWIGLALLPFNLHRSLPTALILLVLCVVLRPCESPADSRCR